MPCNVKDTLIAISNYKEEKITKIAKKPQQNNYIKLITEEFK